MTLQRGCLAVLVLISLGACGEDDAPFTIDDGNDAGGDSGSVGACGDFTRDEREACDDGNTRDGDYCSADCSAVTGECGDDVKQSNEGCDDGDRDGYCNDTCDGSDSFCGDGILQDIEQCDPGDTESPGCFLCQVRGTSRCEGEPSLCGPTSLAWNLSLEDYTENQIVDWCSWSRSALFGTGSRISCGDGIDVVARTNDECVSAFSAAYGTCAAPLRQLLECYRGHAACDFSLPGDENRSLNACIRNTCTSQRCEPNTWSCNGNIAHHCNQWGNGYEDTDCGTGTCNAAFPDAVTASQVCGLAICTPNTWSCNGNTAQLCAPDGLAYAQDRDCGDAFCVSGGAAATPMNMVCDVNECWNGEHNCDANATCTNTFGSFTCTCNSGYAGDGTLCDINECLSQQVCGTYATCSNTPGSFTCICDLGFTLSVDGINCEDANECLDGTHQCGTGDFAGYPVCENAFGGYNCSSPN